MASGNRYHCGALYITEHLHTICEEILEMCCESSSYIC